MKTIEQKAEENSKKYGPEWGDFTRKEIYEDGYIQGAKDQEELTLRFAVFCSVKLWQYSFMTSTWNNPLYNTAKSTLELYSEFKALIEEE